MLRPFFPRSWQDLRAPFFPLSKIQSQQTLNLWLTPLTYPPLHTFILAKNIKTYCSNPPWSPAKSYECSILLEIRSSTYPGACSIQPWKPVPNTRIWCTSPSCQNPFEDIPKAFIDHYPTTSCVDSRKHSVGTPRGHTAATSRNTVETLRNTLRRPR